MVRAALFLPGITPDWSLVGFLLDTGAATTCLHPWDATERVGISEERLQDRDAWDRAETHSGVGGGAIYYVVRARYALLDERGEWKIIEGAIRIAHFTPTNESLPSILGWDILRRFAISLDWEQRVVELR
jgi:hypothetical protein